MGSAAEAVSIVIAPIDNIAVGLGDAQAVADRI
jgi:hypothetical protein